jgi:hypothetical protein
MNGLKITTLLLLALLTGCRLYAPPKSPDNYYFINPHKNIGAIGRTTLIELTNNSAYPKMSKNVTQALFQSMQKKQLFGLTVIHKEDTVWQNLQLGTETEYTLEKLALIQKTLNCDAILKGTITGYEPFPNMHIGLRLELIDLNDGQLLWALEQIWDTSDKKVKDRIKKYNRHHILPGSATLEEKLGTVSPKMFIKFVAHETAETLRPDKSSHWKPVFYWPKIRLSQKKVENPKKN